MSDKTVTIGGQTYPLPAEITLGQIKRFNEARKEVAKGNDDIVEMTLVAVRIVSAAMVDGNPQLDATFIEKNLKPSEFAGMREAMWEVLLLTGLYTRVEKKDAQPGEGEAPAAPTT